jgi:hypothetical protein
MPRQAGTIILDGKIDNLSFYTDSNGVPRVRKRGGPKGNKIKTHGKYARLREHMSEFSRASAVSSKMLSAFAHGKLYFSDGSHFNRLTGLLNAIQHTHFHGVKGTRDPFEGNVYLLEDFQWNTKLAFDEALDAETAVYMDAATGKAHLHIAPFVPATALKAPAGATHFQLLARGAAIYKNGDDAHYNHTGTPPLPINGLTTDAFDLEVVVDKLDEGILLLAAGIIFFRQEMEVYIPLRAGCLGIVGVERIKSGKLSSEETLLSEADRIKLEKENKEKRDIAFQRALAGIQDPRLDADQTETFLSPAQKADQDEKRIRLKQANWLKKINKYRRG